MAFESNRKSTESDANAVLADLKQFRAMFKERLMVDLEQIEGAARELRLVDDATLFELAARIEDLAEQLQGMLVEVRGRAHYAIDRSEAIQLASTANALQAELDRLLGALHAIEAALEQRTSPSQSSLSKVLKTTQSAVNVVVRSLKPILRSLSTRLWRMLVGLMTPKEWSISGELGTGVLGLASVKLEITFGP